MWYWSSTRPAPVQHECGTNAVPMQYYPVPYHNNTNASRVQHKCSGSIPGQRRYNRNNGSSWSWRCTGVRMRCEQASWQGTMLLRAANGQLGTQMNFIYLRKIDNKQTGEHNDCEGDVTCNGCGVACTHRDLFPSPPFLRGPSPPQPLHIEPGGRPSTPPRPKWTSASTSSM